VLRERLQDGGTIVCAEGYMWEVERRGFLQYGAFLPEVVLERPSIIRSLHEEFVLSGSDVVEAFTVSVIYFMFFSELYNFPGEIKVVFH
jgi:betaine-homocysteine S-methyltransferase